MRQKNKVIFSFVMMLVTATSYSSGQSIPREVSKFLDNESRVLSYKTGDLNKDGRQDAVVIIESIADDQEYGHARTLLVFLRNKKNILEQVVKNNNVIACSKCSNYEPYPDPLSNGEITLGKGMITITQYFDIRFNPSFSIYKFKYQPKTHKFKTIMVRNIVFKLKQPEGEYRKYISNHVAQYGKSLDDFNPDWHNLKKILDEDYDTNQKKGN